MIVGGDHRTYVDIEVSSVNIQAISSLFKVQVSDAVGSDIVIVHKAKRSVRDSRLHKSHCDILGASAS